MPQSNIPTFYLKNPDDLFIKITPAEYIAACEPGDIMILGALAAGEMKNITGHPLPKEMEEPIRLAQKLHKELYE